MTGDVSGRTGAHRRAAGAGRMVIRVRNVTRGTVLAREALVAETLRSRLVGLIGRAELSTGAGLVLPHTPWVHTALMSFPIDVVFYSHGGYVQLVVEGLAPWRVSPICWRAYAALELPASTVHTSGTRDGDLLRIEPVPRAVPAGGAGEERTSLQI
ncbi:MAG: DUF192 domain-containing protein [Chloroflexota bacterium]